MDSLPRVTEILRSEGLSDFSMVPMSIMEPAQKFGTAVHKATELWDKETLDVSILSEPLVPYLNGWKKFLSDFNGIFIVPEFIEKSFISKKWGFRGTPDRIVLIDKKTILVDIKTSTGMYPSTSVQTAAYQILVEENTGLRIKERWGIQLNEQGEYKITPYTKISDRTVFLSALNLYKWKKENL